MARANDTQVGGNHYQGTPLQHWDLSVLFQWDPFQYQITKYIMRWRDKNGLLDVEKCGHFVQRYVEAIRAGHYTQQDRVPPLPAPAWYAALGVHMPMAGQSPQEFLEAVHRHNDRLHRRYSDEVVEQALQLRGAILAGAINPSGWKGFTYEGSKEGRDLFRCTRCCVFFAVEENTPPLSHKCDDGHDPMARSGPVFCVYEGEACTRGCTLDRCLAAADDRATTIVQE